MSKIIEEIEEEIDGIILITTIFDDDTEVITELLIEQYAKLTNGNTYNKQNKTKIMATYRIYKQLIPLTPNENTPSWAKNDVWVAKLNSEDTIDEFSLKKDATAKMNELIQNDPTNREYKIEKVG